MNSDLTLLLDHLADRAVLLQPKSRPPSWTEEEDEYIKKNLGWMTDEEMGQALGRSGLAVHLRWDRDLGLPGPSKNPNVVTAHKAAGMLRIDGHKTAHWVDMGLIPGRIMAGGRNIRLIDRQAFRRWVLNPMNWVWFDPKKVRDPDLKHMLQLRAARWGDEWWTTPQVAKYHGVPTKNVEQQIARGVLKSFHLPISLGGRDHNRRWSNHFVLRSDAMRAIFLRGKGNRKHCKFTPDADAWLLKARDELGLTFVAIGRMMKIGKEKASWSGGCSNPTIAYRYHQLKEMQAKTKKTRKSTKR